MQYHKVPQAFWLYTSACLFYTHPPTPGFLARHHAPRSTTVWVSFFIQTFNQTPHTTATIAWANLCGCIQMLAYFTPTRQPQAFWPDTTHHKSQEYWQACGCIQVRAYFTPTRQPQAFWPDTTHHKSQEYWQAFWLYTSACLFYTRPPTPGFLARHHAPRSTTVWVSFYIQTPRTTNLNSIGRLVAVYKCVLILHPPANPRLFGQTPRTTVFFSVGKFLHPDFSPDTTHHKSQQYWQAGGCLQMCAYLTPARQPQAFWPDTTHHGLLQCG